MGDVRTVKLKFSQLEFLEDNPRTIKEPRLKILSERIKSDPTFFDNRPCLVNFIDGRYICYAGFQRAHAAAKVLKWKEIPCSVENDVPTDLMRRRAIYDNTHDGEWNSEVLSSWEYEVEEYRDMGVPEWVFGEDGESEEINPDELGEGFALRDGDRAAFQQMTFTLADEQATEIKNAIGEMQRTDEYKYAETFGNENGNGNALYLIIREWVGQKILS